MPTSSELHILSRTYIHSAYQVCAHFFTRVYSASNVRVTEARSSPNRSSTMWLIASSTCRCTTLASSSTILSNLAATASSMRLSKLSASSSSSEIISCESSIACRSRRYPCSSSPVDTMMVSMEAPRIKIVYWSK